MEELKGKRTAYEEVIEMINNYILLTDSPEELMVLTNIKANIEGRVAEVEFYENSILEDMERDDRMARADQERRTRRALANIVVNC